MNNDMSDSDDGEYIPLHKRLASDVSAGSSFADPITLSSSDSDADADPQPKAPQSEPREDAAPALSWSDEDLLTCEPAAPSEPAAPALSWSDDERSCSPAAPLPSPPPPPAATGARRGRGGAAAGRQKRLERELRRAEAAARRTERPEHCQKALHALVDRRVLEVAGGGELLAALQQSSDVTVHVVTAALPATVTWEREVTESGEQDGQVVSTTRRERQDQLVAVLEAPALASLVSEQQEGGGCGLSGALLELGRSSGLQVTVLCWGLDALCRTKTLAGSYRQSASASSKPSRARPLDRLQLEAALVDAMLDTPHSVRLVGSAADGGRFLAQIGKAVAEAPFKRRRGQTQFSWCAEADSARPVRVDRQLRGLRRLWTEQLRQLTGGSLEAAQAVAEAYPGPQCLMKAYSRCASPAERGRLVADLAVRRSVGPLVSSRRVGAETSRRLYRAIAAEEAAEEL